MGRVGGENQIYYIAQVQVLKFLFNSLSSHDSDLSLTFLTLTLPSPDLDLDLDLSLTISQENLTSLSPSQKSHLSFLIQIGKARIWA